MRHNEVNELSGTPGKFQRKLWPYLAICVAIPLMVGATDILQRDEIWGRLPPRTSQSDVQFHYQTLYVMQTEGVLDNYEAQWRASENMWQAPPIRFGGGLMRLPFLFYLLYPIPVNAAPLEDGLYVYSQAISVLTLAVALSTMFFIYWSLEPLSRGAALAAALLMGFTNGAIARDFQFQTYGMPFLALSFGFWLRRRFGWSALFVAIPSLIHENYVVTFPAYLLASLVGRTLRPFVIYAIAFAITFAIIAAHITYLGLWESYQGRARELQDSFGLAQVLIWQFGALGGFDMPSGSATRLILGGNVFAVLVYARHAWGNPRQRQVFIVLLLLALFPLANIGGIKDAAQYAAMGKLRYFTQSFIFLPMLYALAWRTVLGYAVPLPSVVTAYPGRQLSGRGAEETTVSGEPRVSSEKGCDPQDQSN